MAKMIKLSNIDYLDSLEKKEQKEIISSLAEVASEIRSEYSSVFVCDQKLINKFQCFAVVDYRSVSALFGIDVYVNI